MRRALSGRQSDRLPSATGEAPGTVLPCPACGEPRTVRETQAAWQGRRLRYWSDCACVRDAVAQAEALSQDAIRRQRGSRDESGAAAAYDIEQIAQAGVFTLRRFNPAWLTVAPAAPHPYDLATRWLHVALARGAISEYRGGPPAALYFRGLPGRGKTHLALALALEAHAAGRRVALCNEAQYLHQLLALPFGPALDALVSVPGEKAWLTVFDDIGKRQPGAGLPPERVQAAWYTVIDARYNARRGWTIFTSEFSLDELVRRGTINPALHGRMYEMTQGREIAFVGEDQRLRVD